MESEFKKERNVERTKITPQKFDGGVFSLSESPIFIRLKQELVRQIRILSRQLLLDEA